MKKTLNLPPFPPLEWDGYCWEGSVLLPAWAGFQSRQGNYEAVSSTIVSDGLTYLNIMTPDGEQTSPAPEQAEAYQYLLQQQEAVRDSILATVFANYATWQEQYGYKGEEAQQFMPDIQRPEQLKPLIGLSTVHFFNVAKDGMAYVGWLFGCTWDVEHGLGAMTHANRVVEVGGADAAILDWIAENDKG